MGTSQAVRIVSEREIRRFLDQRPEAKDVMRRFVTAICAGRWESPAELRQTFPHASFVNDCTVFNIGGNHYRLVAFIHYRKQIVYVNRIGTHKEYDEWKF